MKKVLILALILISVKINAQYSKNYQLNHNKSFNNPTVINEFKDPRLYIPTIVLTTTFTINETNVLTNQQKLYSCLIGSAISVGLYFYLSKHTKKSKNKFIFVYGKNHKFYPC